MNTLKKIIFFNLWLSNYIARKFPSFAKDGDYTEQLIKIVNMIIKSQKSRSVLEAGGINRPLLQRTANIRYDGLDIEHNQQCKSIYDNFFVQSVEEPITGKYDLIISRTLLEHVQNNDACAEQLHNALTRNGYTVHYLPSKYHPYSLILQLVGPKWQMSLIKTLRPWAAEVTGYQTFFHKCSPSEMKTLFLSKGFRNIRIVPFFRANDYFKCFFPCYVAVTFWENICSKLNLEQLCSGFIIIAQK